MSPPVDDGREWSDPSEFAEALFTAAERCSWLTTRWLARNGIGAVRALGESLTVGSAFLEIATRMVTDPAHIVRSHVSLWQTYMEIWQNTTSRVLGGPSTIAMPTAPQDQRFESTAWRDYAVFDVIRQSYLVTSHWLEETVRGVAGLDPRARELVDFYTRQFINAMSPANFVLTNPEVLRATVESGGENLVRGLQNLLDDLEIGSGLWREKHSFVLGRDVAATPGKVILRNDVMEVLQYTPTTDTVRKTPILFIPPWINKFYIVDLRAPYSWVRWLVDRGHTVFAVSWAEPHPKRIDRTLAGYVLDGVMPAIDAVAAATGPAKMHVSGYCLGGTLLAIALAYAAAKGEDRVVSASFFNAVLDFTDSGELGAIIDDATFSGLGGNLPVGSIDVSRVRNLLHENDLIWSFVVDSYLLGRDRFPFDILRWNADVTRLPRALHGDYLEHCRRHNRLARPRSLILDGVGIDLSRITVPTYILAAREDHVSPWRSVFAGIRLLGGPTRFALTTSGHMAGLINPPGRRTARYWAGPASTKQNVDAWHTASRSVANSWWRDWEQWLDTVGGDVMVPARRPGDGVLGVIASAPGRYVRGES